MTDDPRLSRRAYLGATGAAMLTGEAAVKRGTATRSPSTGPVGSQASDAMAQTGESWPTFQYDAANTGVAPDGWRPVETPLVERWSFRSPVEREGDDEQYRSPVVADGLVAVGTRSNNCYGIDAATGEHRWTFETIGTGTPAIDGERVYVGSLDNYLYALDAATGDIVWELDTGSSMKAAPAVVDGTVYAMQAQFGSDVLAVDAETGEQLWSFSRGIAGPPLGAPSVVDGSVYAASGTSNQADVVSLDAATGEREWGFSTDRDTTPREGESGGSELSSFGNPTAADGTVYVGSEHGYCYALDAADGRLQWEREIGTLYSSPAVDGDTVLFSTTEQLLALEAATGDQQWVVEFDTGSAIRSSPIVVGDRVLATTGGTLSVVAATDGTVVETYDGVANWLATPAVVGGVVYVGGDQVTALAPPGANPGETLRRNERTDAGDSGRPEDDDSSGSVFTQFGDSNALVGLATGSVGFAAGYLGYQRLRGDEPEPRGPTRPR